MTRGKKGKHLPLNSVASAKEEKGGGKEGDIP